MRRNTNIEELGDAHSKIMNWFFAYPSKEVSLNDLCSEIRMSKTTANKAVRALEKDGFLKKEVLGRIWRISCNHNHSYNHTLKVSFNLGKVYQSGILQSVHKLIRNPRAIVLFGSYRKGDDNEKSDIDIAVEVLDEEELKIKSLGNLARFGYRNNVPVNVHIFSRKKIDLNLFSNIANGIVLEGYLEVRP